MVKVKDIQSVNGFGNMQHVYSLGNPDIISRKKQKFFSYKELVELTEELSKDKPECLNISFGIKSSRKSCMDNLCLVGTRENSVKDIIDNNRFKYIDLYGLTEDKLRDFYTGKVDLALEARTYIWNEIYYETEEEAVEVAKYIQSRYPEYVTGGIHVNWVLLWRDGDEAERKTIKLVK